jgi:Tfp pilus assembly protein PilX
MLKLIPKQKSYLNERGFASLIVGLILIVVLGLMTVGFARLSRHEQQQALSSQLATEANYAAESGINDAVQEINSKLINTSTTNVDSNSCLKLPLPGMSANSNYISSTDGVSYTCVLVNLETAALAYGNVNYGDSRTVVTNATNQTTGSPLTSLSVSWGSNDSHNTYPTLGTNFPGFTSWNPKNYPPLLEFTVTPLAASMTRAQLINDVFTVYMYPSASGPDTVTYNVANQTRTTDGSVVAGNCNTNKAPYNCQVTINGLTGTGQYLIHFLNFYDAANVHITGEDVNGDSVAFTGGQAEVDVTGKAKDVLKRLNVSVPLGSNSVYPTYSVEAQNICKRFETSPTSTTYIDPSGGQAATTSPCTLETSSTPSTPASPSTPTTPVASCAISNTTSTDPAPSGDPGNWGLNFDDEFTASSLNTKYWSDKVNVGEAVENNVAESPSNVAFSGGDLLLTLSSSSLGASINTDPSQGMTGYSFGDGYFVEARICFPGSGQEIYNWPAFWTVDNDTEGGEIDIAEGQQSLGTNYHCAQKVAECDYESGPIPGVWAAGWHTYGVDRENGINYVYWDGKQIASYKTLDNGAANYIVLNVGNSTGLDCSCGGTSVYGADSTVKVDYVRAWKKD